MRALCYWAGGMTGSWVTVSSPALERLFESRFVTICAVNDFSELKLK